MYGLPFLALMPESDSSFTLRLENKDKILSCKEVDE